MNSIIKKCVVLIVLLSTLIFIGCENDDSFVIINKEYLFSYTWKLGSVITDRPTDYNNDGVYHNDIVEDCKPFSFDMFLDFYEDGTFYLYELVPHPEYLYESGLPVSVFKEYNGLWYLNSEKAQLTLDYRDPFKPIDTFEIIELSHPDFLTGLILEIGRSDKDGSYMAQYKLGRIY